MDKPKDAATQLDEEFAYRPLVAKGEDREAKLAEVIERWVTETPTWLNEQGRAYDSPYMRESKAALVGIELRDENEGAEPIDLGRDLLCPLVERLHTIHESSATLPVAVVALFDCRVLNFNACSLNAPVNLLLSGTRTIVEQANIQRVRLHGNVDFKDAAFRGRAFFCDDKVGGFANFRNAVFSDSVTFNQTTFRDSASFANAVFCGAANFGGASFEKGIGFSDATFNHNLFFGGVVFEGMVRFDYAVFRGVSRFRGSDLRRAVVAYSTQPIQEFTATKKRYHNWTDPLNWRRVRSLGELTAFTQVSYLALAGVPLLAGLWGPVRRGTASLNGTLDSTAEKLDTVIEWSARHPVEVPQEIVESLHEAAGLLSGTLPETMPLGWLLAFLAAFCVVIAQLIYQTQSPALIRQSSEDDLIEEANERNRIDNEITDERLREAIGYLKEAADMMPHRHNQWFVRRHKRTVWIPDNLEHFKPAQIPVFNSTGEKVVDPDGESETYDDPNPEIQPEDRKRIAIEEGQRARYAVSSFEARSAAWISGGLYLLAGWLLLLIVLRQLAHVADASPATWLAGPMYVLSYGPLVLTGSITILAATVVGALSVHNPAWWAFFTGWMRKLSVILWGSGSDRTESK